MSSLYNRGTFTIRGDAYDIVYTVVVVEMGETRLPAHLHMVYLSVSVLA